MDKRITVFTGHYGSGKTEVAINYAKKLKDDGFEVIIVDFDIVNPYYRAKDAEEFLKSNDIKLISSKFANTNIDIPAIPQEILSVFKDKTKKVIFDVGGDDDGAIALGRFYSQFAQEEYEMLMVINAKRPLTNEPKSIILYLEMIEKASRLSFTGLINNTNLGIETSISDIIAGEKIVELVAEQQKIPKVFTSVRADLVLKMPKEFKIFPIDIYLSNPWLQNF